MRIDSTHRAWLAASLVILGVATAAYIVYATRSPSGPRGGSAIGLTFGIIGSAFMVFAGLLGARKKVPVWRLGRAQAWMRGHLWLGLLSLPLICFHAGFRFGGALTTVLMILLLIVVASGIFGAVLQHYIPSVVTERVPMETIFEQIGNIRTQLIAEADEMVDAICGPASLELPAIARIVPVGGAPLPPTSSGTLPLRKFYSREVRPFLRNEAKRPLSLSNEVKAKAMFEGLTTLLPDAFHETIRNLEQICEEERQLRRQITYHHWLHGWLMLHVPLSLALLLLGCAHAIMALRY
ncbi:MAG: hypothetical protein WB987_06980 [Candidatus Acidiferrales bacterium]